MKNTRSSGFTLIELLITMSIISILAMMGVLTYQSAQRSARDSQRKNDLKTIQYALTEWKQDNPNTTYPTTANWSTFFSTLRSNYMKGQTVQDPRGTTPYVYSYIYQASDDTYTLRACLENANDAQGTAVGVGECTGGSGRKFEIRTP